MQGARYLVGYYTKAKHKECITEMREIYGDYAVYCFCILNAYKYQYRAGLKSGNTAESDISKAIWYLNYSSNLRKTKHKLRFNIFAWLMYNTISRRIKHGLF